MEMRKIRRGGVLDRGKGIYCDAIFLCGVGCQIFRSHPVFLAPTIWKIKFTVAQAEQVDSALRPSLSWS